MPTPTKAGYTFNGWQTSDGTTVTSTTQNTTIGDHTLTASWTANNYTLTLYDNKNILNGGELTTSQDLNSWGNSSASIVTEDGTPCTKISGEFGQMKWFYQDILSRFSPNTEYIIGLKIKVVNYVAGSIDPFLKIYIEGHHTGSEYYPSLGGTHELGQYSGTGWNNICYHFVSLNEDYSIYDKIYSYIYARDFAGNVFFRNYSLALATNTNKVVTFDSSNYDIEKPTYAGYSFQGYYTQPVGGTKIFNADCSAVKNVSGYTDSNGTWIKTDNVKLYAQWAENNYTLTLYENKNILNGGELTTSQDLNNWENSSASIVTEDGAPCTKISGEFGQMKWFYQYILNRFSSNTEYIIGLKTKVVNYVAGSINPFLSIYIEGHHTGSEYYPSLGGTHELGQYSGTGWNNICYHFVSLDEDYSTHDKIFLYIYARDFTGDIFFRNFSLAPATNTTRSVKYSSNIGSVSPLTYSGFAFNGYYTQPSGGVKIYNADGSLVKGVAGYTDSSGAWIRAEDTKLYGHWTQN